MQYLYDIIREPSSYAGLSLLTQAVPALLANPTDPLAWAAVLTALAAILKRESFHV